MAPGEGNMTGVAQSSTTPRPGSGRGLVLCTPASGPDDTPLHELCARFADHDVELCAPELISRRVRDARIYGRPFVGIAGGDGSIRVAAETLAHSGTALLAIPAGRHNDFARMLGIETIDDAIKAAECVATRLVDLGRVNGRAFVISSSLGFYPAVVARRDDDRSLLKPLADMRAVLHQLRVGRRIVVQLDRQSISAWLVFVGNGCYGDTIGEVTTRERHDSGLLDVRVVRAERRFGRTRLVAAALVGRSGHTPILDRRTHPEMTIAVRGRRTVDVALDGEHQELAAPLHYESDAQALGVLVPG